MANGILLSAVLTAIRTTTDGGWKITFDIDDSQAEKILQLSQFREDLVNLDVSIPVCSNEILGLPNL